MEAPVAENCRESLVQMTAEALVEMIRVDMVESVHSGHIAIVHADGGLVGALGDVETTIFPRSSSKMIQALPLLESGAGANLSEKRLALACASHSGERACMRTTGFARR